MIVGEGGCSPTYFLEEMQWWEVNRYISGNRRKERATMEGDRLLGFWLLNAMGAKLHLPTDLITFPWEKETTDEQPTDKEIEELHQAIREENERLQREQSQSSATANQSKPTA